MTTDPSTTADENVDRDADNDADLAARERHRLAVLEDHRTDALVDSPALRRITDFAAALCEAKIALVSLVGRDRQSFLARTGLGDTGTPRDQSFCAHAMGHRDVMIVPDATLDSRFADNPLVMSVPNIRFYAGAPLITEDGVALGALCVIDDTPRAGLTAVQAQGLALLAEQVMHLLDSHRGSVAHRDAAVFTTRALAESEERFRVLTDAMPQMVWSTLPDGYHDYYNARWYEFTGMPPGSTDGEEWNGMFHPDDQERAWARWRHSLATGEPYQIDYRLRAADGNYRWTLGRALPLRDESGVIVRWFGTCTDIHDSRMLLEEREVITQELSHRIKNIFSVISGLIAFAARNRPDFAPIATDLRERITALGRAHDFVRPHSAKLRPATAENTLHGLLRELFLPYQLFDIERVTVAGDDVPIDDRSTTPLALLFHELATNATKYGALSNDMGRALLTITQRDGRVMLDWNEAGGPATASPDGPPGFGSQLIELSVVRQMGGGIEREWRPAGLRLGATIPLASFSR